MGDRVTDLSFEDWIVFVFCWPENPGGSLIKDVWLTDEYWDGSPAVRIAYLTRLFEQSVTSLSDYSDREIAQGLWDIVSDSDYGAALADVTVPLSDRRRCIDAIARLFRDLFATRCTPHLEHCSETGNPLNGVCYMWWDLFWMAPAPEEKGEIAAAIVRSLTTILHLPAIACQEAALHGCGHWLELDELGIQTAIDRWLQHHPDLRPELRTYALSARCGCVQ